MTSTSSPHTDRDDAQTRAAFDTLRRQVDGSAVPMILVEYGEAMNEKFIFMRLDWAENHQIAKELGWVENDPASPHTEDGETTNA